MPDKSLNLFGITVAGISGHVTAQSLHEELGNTLDILSEIDSSVSAQEDGSVEWRIVSASTQSPLSLHLEPHTNLVGNFATPILDAFFVGLEHIESGAAKQAPPHFTPKAMKAVARLTEPLGKDILELTYHTPRRRYTPTARLGKNADRIINPPKASEEIPGRLEYHEFGELEGKVDNLIGHDQLYFSMYDVLSHDRISCYFAPEMSEQVRAAWKKRVTVEGRIKYGVDGKPKQVKVSAITIQKAVDELPQFKDFSVNITGGVESSEFIRGLRDE